jgi:formyl-CoA transferase
VPVPGSALRLGDSPVAPLRPAPPLGQSTEEILAELHRHAEAADDAGLHLTREEARHVVDA